MLCARGVVATRDSLQICLRLDHIVAKVVIVAHGWIEGIVLRLWCKKTMAIVWLWHIMMMKLTVWRDEPDESFDEHDAEEV